MSYFIINNNQNPSIYVESEDNQAGSLNAIIESDSCCSCFSNIGMFFSNLKNIITARESVNEFRNENDDIDQIYTIASNTSSAKALAVLNLVIPPLSRD